MQKMTASKSQSEISGSVLAKSDVESTKRSNNQKKLKDQQAVSDIFFPNTNPTAISYRKVTILNISQMPVSYHWSIYR